MTNNTNYQLTKTQRKTPKRSMWKILKCFCTRKRKKSKKSLETDIEIFLIKFGEIKFTSWISPWNMKKFWNFLWV